MTSDRACQAGATGSGLREASGATDSPFGLLGAPCASLQPDPVLPTHPDLARPPPGNEERLERTRTLGPRRDESAHTHDSTGAVVGKSTRVVP